MRMELRVYRFGPGGDFAGQLVGALERIESGGSVRVADALFVGRDAESGDISAIALDGRRLDAMVAALLDFRLDGTARARATDRALAVGPVRALAEGLAPGTAVGAVLLEHAWSDALEDAVARTGGVRVLDEMVAAGSLADLAGQILGAAA